MKNNGILKHICPRCLSTWFFLWTVWLQQKPGITSFRFHFATFLSSLFPPLIPLTHFQEMQVDQATKSMFWPFLRGFPEEILTYLSTAFAAQGEELLQKHSQPQFLIVWHRGLAAGGVLARIRSSKPVPKCLCNIVTWWNRSVAFLLI